MHRFLLPDTPLVVGNSADLAPLAHQLRHVLRAEVGDRIVLLDGQGNAFMAELVELGRKQVVATIVATVEEAREPTVRLSLYQAALKGDRMEWVLQKATELGVACIVPVISARTITRPADAILHKYPRWQAILREAAEQCGRTRVPALLPPMSWSEAVQQGQGLRLLPWEAADQNEGLETFLHSHFAQLPAPNPISLIIGPEGGLATEEAEGARRAGWRIAGLGPRILRAETAALVAVTLIMAAAGELDQPPRVAPITAEPA